MASSFSHAATSTLSASAQVTRDEYDSFAPYYNQRYIAHRPDIDTFMAVADIKPGEHVLDLGCGTGWLLVAAKKQSGSGQVVGVDISTKMLEEAHHALMEAGLSESVILHCGNIEDLSSILGIQISPTWKGFDVISCFWTLSSLPREQRGAVLEHWSHLLSPGGRIVMNHNHPFDVMATFESMTMSGQSLTRQRLADKSAWEECEADLRAKMQTTALTVHHVHWMYQNYPDRSPQVEQLARKRFAKSYQSGFMTWQYLEYYKMSMIKKWTQQVQGRQEMEFLKLVAVLGVLRRNDQATG